MSSADEISIHPSLKLIFPTENAVDACEDKTKQTHEDDIAWHFYSHSILRKPSDLSLHTRRVFFAMEHKNAELLPGSLHDLFYTLKDGGEKLRIRLLKASLPYLSKDDINYFAMWIKSGIKNGMGYQWREGSVLSHGLFGPDQELISLTSNATENADQSPLEESRACMEYGQFDVAQQILVDALKQDPDNSLLQDELDYLSNYAKSREIDPTEKKTSRNLGGAVSRLKNKLFS